MGVSLVQRMKIFLGMSVRCKLIPVTTKTLHTKAQPIRTDIWHVAIHEDMSSDTAYKILSERGLLQGHYHHEVREPTSSFSSMKHGTITDHYVGYEDAPTETRVSRSPYSRDKSKRPPRKARK